MNNLFPVVTRISSKTISNDIVSVNPMSGITPDIYSEVKKENRDRKIDCILNGKIFEELLIEDHPDYKGPKSMLFYLDYTFK